METKKRVTIVRNISLIAFMLNCASVVFTIWADNYIAKFIASAMWFVTQCWMLFFIYANFIYVPKDEIILKKRKPKSKRLCNISHKKINPNFIKVIDFIGAAILIPIFLICSYRFIAGDIGYDALYDLGGMLISFLGIADIAIVYIPEVWTRIIK